MNLVKKEGDDCMGVATMLLEIDGLSARRHSGWLEDVEDVRLETMG